MFSRRHSVLSKEELNPQKRPSISRSSEFGERSPRLISANEAKLRRQSVIDEENIINRQRINQLIESECDKKNSKANISNDLINDSMLKLISEQGFIVQEPSEDNKFWVLSWE